MDVFTKEKRSEIMSKVRSEWTSCEVKLHNELKGMKIKHKMHPNIPGKPDILISKNNTLVFVDGCFWHGCSKHCRMPATNKRYWAIKIKKNIKRDKKNRAALRKEGYKVVRLWEHDLKSDVSNTICRRVLLNHRNHQRATWSN